MEGFWTIQFTGIQGWGAGVVTLVGGRVFGGDSGYLYEGTYTQQANTLHARVHVRPLAAGVPNVMGLSEFDLEMTGTLSGSAIPVTGSIPGTPLRLSGTLTKRQDLPTRAGVIPRLDLRS